MTAAVPLFPLTPEPGEWSAVELLAATIMLEAEGEPDEGQLAVAYVVRNRMDQWGLPLHQVILGRDGRAWGDGKPFEVFSCWNDDYRHRAEARLSDASDESRERAYRAAASAYWKLLPDPTVGACFYLNVPLTLRIRKGSLPAWAADPENPKKINQAKVTAVIGRHHFLRG